MSATLRVFLLGSLYFGCAKSDGLAQSIAAPWSGHGHDAQHTGVSFFASKPLQSIHWQTPVDLLPQYSGSVLLIHYGCPLITRANTVILPVKTGAHDGFRIEAHRAADGALVWTQTTDFSVSVPGSYGWTPSCGITLTPKNRVYFPGAGGTVYFRDDPDVDPAPNSGQVAFYGLDYYLDDSDTRAAFDSAVKINTPLTSDRYGNIYFGFQVATGAVTTPQLQSGIARITPEGTGSWVAASAAVNDSSIFQVVTNCAPALSNDHKTLYVAVSRGDFTGGYLVALDSRTLATQASVELRDVKYPNQNALLPDDGTASPTIGPDGDVYFGVFESSIGENNERGWLLHFDSGLSQVKTAGAFGWDDTPSVVAASLVPSYTGASSYLLLCKYNNYAGIGSGNGHNRVAILDPNAAATDPITGATVMQEVISVLGPTPDPAHNSPGAVREWCINSAAIDPFSKSAIIPNEDGRAYRWDFASNSLTESLELTNGLGEAYTPSVVGVDGLVYLISNATLFAVGN